MAWIAGWGLSFIIFNVAVEVLQTPRFCTDPAQIEKEMAYLRGSREPNKDCFGMFGRESFHAKNPWQEDVGTLLLEFFRYFGHEYRWGEGFKMKPALHALFPPALLPWQEWYPPDSRYAICTSSWGRARSSDSNLKLCRSGGPTSH